MIKSKLFRDFYDISETIVSHFATVRFFTEGVTQNDHLIYVAWKTSKRGSEISAYVS
jgi:hypothetical protein